MGCFIMTDRYVEQINISVNISTDFILGRSDVVSKTVIDGKNLHRPEKIIDDSRRVSGNSNNLANSRGDSYWYIDYMDIKPNTQYTFSIKTGMEYEDGVYYHVLDKDYELVLGSGRNPQSVENGHTFTTPINSKYIRYSFQYGTESAVQLEEDGVFYND